MFVNLFVALRFSQFKAQAYPISIYVLDIPDLYAVTLPTPSDPTFSFGANLHLAELEVICKISLKLHWPRTFRSSRSHSHPIALLCRLANPYHGIGWRKYRDGVSDFWSESRMDH
jgi:hypothetical protein